MIIFWFIFFQFLLWCYQLIDIQPSKEGGFQGTISGDISPSKREALVSYLTQGSRKRVRLDSWKGGRGPSGGRKVTMEGYKKDWDDTDSHRR